MAKSKPYGRTNQYSLQPEHKARFAEWRDLWVLRALRTEPQTESDRDALRVAMRGMYQAAKRQPPTREVFAASPLSAAIAAGCAAGAWWVRDNDVDAKSLFGPVSEAQIMGAVHRAAEISSMAARGIKSPIPRAATRDATLDATSAATYAATDDATRAATDAETNDRLVSFFLRCVGLSYRMRNGGNQWAGWCSYLSFFDRVAGLGLPEYTAWRHYEAAAIHGGPRYLHKRFWIASDFPLTVGRDEQNRPHCETGPQLAWRDGFTTWYLHGIKVPSWIVQYPERITVETIEAEQNAEVRRVMAERYGISNYVRDARFEVLDSVLDSLGQPRRLLRRHDVLVIELTNSTVDADGGRRVYHVPCEPELRPWLSDGTFGESQELTALAAVASTYGMTAAEYERLGVET